MKIIPAQTEHLSQISEIYQFYILNSIATFRKAQDGLVEIESFFKDQQRRSLPFLVAIDGEKVIGYSYLYPYKKEFSGYNPTFYDTIYIHPDHLGKGIGKQLLESIILEAKANPKIQNIISIIAVEKDEDLNASMALHQKFGFTVVGRMIEVGYKLGRSIDVVNMQLQFK